VIVAQPGDLLAAFDRDQGRLTQIGRAFLKEHQSDHILMRAAREDALTGLLDLQRLANLLHRIRGRIIARDLDRVSPLAVPVLLEIGKEPVYGKVQDELLSEAADDLVAEATRV